MKLNIPNLNIIHKTTILEPKFSHTTPSFRGELKQDTFERSKKIDNDKKNNVHNVKRWAERLSNDANTAYKIFAAKMENAFGTMCDVEYPDKPIDVNSPITNKYVGKLKLNIKSKTSILEKMLSGNKTTEKEARNEIKDAIRARIILDSKNKNAEEVIKQIIKQVEKGKLEIKTIKNYTTGKDFQYANLKSLRKVAQNCNYKENSKDTGYNAIHIIFKIDNEFDGELQIMGKDVEELKDVEDVFYKLSNNKHVDKKFDNIKKLYNKLEKENPNKLQEQLNGYTKEAYLFQRQKELGLIKNKGFFLPLDTAKYNYLPKEFDFNEIKKIK